MKKQLRDLVRTNKDNPNLVGYYWTDTPQWDLERAGPERRTDWVSALREMRA